MKKISLWGLMILTLACFPVLADEGRIPIYQPTTITASGSYVVTRDIAATTGNIITIQAPDVTIDLNGKTLQLDPSTGGALIFVDTGSSAVHIRNGKLVGGGGGIGAVGTGDPIVFEAENLQILNPASDGISVTNVDTAFVSNCLIRNVGNNGIVLGAYGLASASVRLVNNVLSSVPNYGIIMASFRSVEVRDNVVSYANTGMQIDSGYGMPPGSSIIQGNVLERLPGTNTPGFGIGVFYQGVLPRTSLILDNIVSGFTDGIEVYGSGSRISGNIVHRSFIPSAGGGNGDGIIVSDAQALVEGNQLQGNAGCGIFIKSGVSGVAYRNNMLRGNTGGAVCDSGTGTTDAGGNIL